MLLIGLVAQRRVGAGGEVDQDLLDLLDVGVLERPHLPEALRRRAVAVVGRIEEVVEPALRLGEALVLAQVDGDRQRHVEEQLPVVDRVGAAGGEVEVLDRIGLLHQRRAGLVRGVEEVRKEHRPRFALEERDLDTVRNSRAACRRQAAPRFLRVSLPASRREG